VVDGLCVAGGIELILCCDYVIATDRARFSDGHLNLALLPGAGGTQRMPRLIGRLKAMDLMLTARMIDGRQAADIGLVTLCVTEASLAQTLQDLIDCLAEKSFAARSAIKFLVNEGLKGTLDCGLRFERAFAVHFESTHPDAYEGLLAFSEKRKPNFRRTAG
jgi:enoyl-CoA hydratase/carnithine racemase